MGSKLYWLDDYSNHIKSLISKLLSQTVIKKKKEDDDNDRLHHKLSQPIWAPVTNYHQLRGL